MIKVENSWDWATYASLLEISSEWVIAASVVCHNVEGTEHTEQNFFATIVY